jgi:ribosome-binding protein aMBF1 (putative translation factor)
MSGRARRVAAVTEAVAEPEGVPPFTPYAELWEDELAQRLGEAARERRQWQGLTQSQVAHRTGLPQSGVARLEAGRHLPTMATLARLAVALDVVWRLEVTPSGARVAAVPAAERPGRAPAPPPAPPPQPH